METTVNERIGQIKSSLNLGTNEFAQQAGIAAGTVWNIENGSNVSPKTIKSISKAFNINIDWIKTGKGKMIPEQQPKTISENANPWKDALVTELKERNTFLEKQTEWLQNLVNNLTQKGGSPNFHKATNVLRAAA